MTPMEATARGLEQAELGFITITEIPDAAQFARIRENIETVNPTEQDVTDFLLENDFPLGQIQSLVDGIDGIGLQAVHEGANEVLAIYSEDDLREMYNALKQDRRFFAIANEIFFVLLEHAQAAHEESISLACKY